MYKVHLPLPHPTSWLALQYEACQQALELLESTPDAQGRKLQVHKVYLPPNLFLSEAEAAAMVVSSRHRTRNAPGIRDAQCCPIYSIEDKYKGLVPHGTGDSGASHQP